MLKDKRNWAVFASKLITLVILMVIFFFMEENIITEKMTLHMIECGQAESFLIVQNKKTALIDCGTEDTADELIEYLIELGIIELDYVIGTCPTEEHMGGMKKIIRNFQVGMIIMPTVEEKEIIGGWYKQLIKEIKQKKHDFKYANLGEVYKVGNASIKIISFTNDYERLRDYSTVLKVSYQGKNIIMSGDIGEAVEKDIIASGENISADILKIANHGGEGSTSKEWLDVINPKYALISCELRNPKQYPAKITMDRIQEKGIEVYRTDECGTVVVTITSEDIEFDIEAGDYLCGEEIENLLNEQ